MTIGRLAEVVRKRKKQKRNESRDKRRYLQLVAGETPLEETLVEVDGQSVVAAFGLESGGVRQRREPGPPVRLRVPHGVATVAAAAVVQLPTGAQPVGRLFVASLSPQEQTQLQVTHWGRCPTGHIENKF